MPQIWPWRQAFTLSPMTEPAAPDENLGCSHLDQIHPVTPSTLEGCEECLKIDSWWVHLRLCLTCGKVGCCDNSPNRHASAHAREAGHPIIRSFEPGEDWWWCFPDDMEVEATFDPIVR